MVARPATATGSTRAPLPGLVALLLLALLALAAALHLGPRGARTVLALDGPRGATPLVLELSPGAKRNVRLSADAGEYVHLVVEQRGVDVEARLLDRRGEPLLVVDRAVGAHGPEPIETVAEEGGPLTLALTAWPGPGPRGEVGVRLAARRPATGLDELRSRALAAYCAAEAAASAGEDERAVDEYRRAADLWARAGDVRWQGESLDRLGDLHATRRRWSEALPLHREAASLFLAAGDARWRAIALTEQGTAHLMLGEVAEALARYREALPIRRQVGDRLGEAITLQGLGHAHHVRLEAAAALDHYEQALALWPEVHHQVGWATTLHNLGVLAARLGRHALAERRLREAAELWDQLARPDFRASTLNQLADLARRRGELQRALDLAQQSLELHRDPSPGAGRARSLGTLGEVLLDLGHFTAAEEGLERALAELADRPAPRSLARIHHALGAARLAAGRPREALASWSLAEELFAEAGEAALRAEALGGIARAHLAVEDPARSLPPMRRALELVESVRATVGTSRLRTSFFSTVQDLYSLHLHLLERALDAAAEPSDRLAAEALETAERARGRSLLDSLESSAPPAAGPHPAGEPVGGEGLETLRRLRREVEQAREIVLSVEASHALGRSGIEAAHSELERLMEALERERRRALDTVPSLTTGVAPPGVAEIREQLLDRETVLVSYRLGEPRSHLWLLTHDDLEWHRISPGSRLGALARDVHRLLDPSAGADRIVQVRALCRLSEALLAPVADRLGARRLLVVADGELAYLPFAALPDPLSAEPCPRAKPLAARMEVVHLPSAGVVASLRRSHRDRPSPDGQLAALADPHLPRGRGAASGDPAGRDGHLAEPLPPLPHSRREAEAIVALAPPPSVALFGADAHKGMVTSGRLNGYRVLHFATHAIVDPVFPELSRIALSAPPGGDPADGFLFAHEIRDLRLPADLVTLSACRSALGADLPGEGMVGLAWSFLYAGAGALLVSLWDVGDEEARRFMESFYEGLFGRRLAPGAALQRAQRLTLERGPRVPYHEWAAFLLVGDWHPSAPDPAAHPPMPTDARQHEKETSHELP